MTFIQNIMAEEQLQEQPVQTAIPVLGEFASVPKEDSPDKTAALTGGGIIESEEERKKRLAAELEEVKRILAIPDRTERFNEIVKTFGGKPDRMSFTDTEGWKEIKAKMKELGTEKYFAMPVGKHTREEIIARHKELVAEYFPEGTKFDVITVNETKDGQETGNQIHIIVGITLEESTGVDKFDKLRKMLGKEGPDAEAKSKGEAMAAGAAVAVNDNVKTETQLNTETQPTGNPMTDQESANITGNDQLKSGAKEELSGIAGSDQSRPTITAKTANVTMPNDVNLTVDHLNLDLSGSKGVNIKAGTANAAPPGTAMTEAAASPLLTPARTI